MPKYSILAFRPRDSVNGAQVESHFHAKRQQSILGTNLEL